MLKVVFFAVLAFYAQGGGKTGAHKWQSDTRTIGGISYLVTQVYEYAHHRAFRGVHQRNSTLNIISFAHVPSDCFLCLLPGRPSLSADARTLRLEETDFEIFLGLKQKLERVGEAVKFLKAARRKGVKNAVTNEGGGGGSGDIHNN
jgi:hypothetical protein